MGQRTLRSDPDAGVRALQIGQVCATPAIRLEFSARISAPARDALGREESVLSPVLSSRVLYRLQSNHFRTCKAWLEAGPLGLFILHYHFHDDVQCNASQASASRLNTYFTRGSSKKPFQADE